MEQLNADNFKNAFLAGAAAGNVGAAANTAAQSVKTKSAEPSTFEKALNDKKTEPKDSVKEKPKSDRKDIVRDKKTENNHEDRNGNKVDAKAKPDDKGVSAKDKAQDGSDTGKADAKNADVKTEKSGEAVKEEKVLVQPVLNEEQTARLIAEIAEALGAEPKKVTDALKKLGLSAEDLTDKQNIAKLLGELNGVDDLAELLKVPNLVQTMNDVQKIVRDAVQNASNQGNVSDGSRARSGELLRNDDNAADVKQTTVTVSNAETESDEADEGVQQEVVAAARSDVKVTNKKADEVAVKPTNEQTIERKATEDVNVSQNSGNGANMSGGQGGQNGAADTAAQGRLGEVARASGGGIEAQVSQVLGNSQSTNENEGVNAPKQSVRTPVKQQTANEVLDQIVDKFKIDFRGKSTEINIQLKPNDLGNLSIKIAQEQGIVTAEIVAENSKVKELIEQNLSELKESLVKQGIDVGELSVSVGQQGSEGLMNQYLKEQERARGRMSQILGRGGDEEAEPVENFADESSVAGNSVDFSA